MDADAEDGVGMLAHLAQLLALEQQVEHVRRAHQVLGALLHHQALVLGVQVSARLVHQVVDHLVVDLDVADDQCVLARRVVADIDGVKYVSAPAA